MGGLESSRLDEIEEARHLALPGPELITRLRRPGRSSQDHLEAAEWICPNGLGIRFPFVSSLLHEDPSSGRLKDLRQADPGSLPGSGQFQQILNQLINPIQSPGTVILNLSINVWC